MSEPLETKHPGSNPDDDAVELLVEKTRGLSLIWLIPLVALAIGLWLAYKTLSEEGPSVSIVFKSASGLEAGKTKIKYKDVEVGVVESVKLSEDLSTVLAAAKMDRTVESHLREGSKFWVVQPRLGLNGVSGLDTLIAGHYIEVEFGQGRPTTHFTGLEHAPKLSADSPGSHYQLLADSAGSIMEGTPIYFRNIQVGRVVEVALAEDNSSVKLDAFVEAPYGNLVRDDSRFWQTSGIEMSMGAQGFNLKVGSLLSLVGSGISFETPNLEDAQAKPSADGTQFTLFKDFASIAEGSHLNKMLFVLYFDGSSVRGLSPGAPVEVRGIRIGTVSEVKFELDLTTQQLRIPVIIEIDPDRVFPREMFEHYRQVNKDAVATGHKPLFEKLVARGLRARLKTGNLLTGQLYVDMDFYPDSPPKTMIYTGSKPELPTLPSVTEELQTSVTEILQKLKKLPLDKIGNELLGTMQGSNRLLNSPELHDSIRSMNSALKDVHQVAQTADRELLKISSGLEKSLAATVKVLEQMEPGSPMSVDIGNLLEELASSARSIRTLTDYLERHPEALLHGKGGAKK